MTRRSASTTCVLGCLSALVLASAAAVATSAAAPRLAPSDPPHPWRTEIEVVTRPDPPDLVCPPIPRRSRAPAARPTDEIPNADDLRELTPPPESTARVTLDPALISGFALKPLEGGGVAPLRVAVYGDSHVAAGMIGEEFVRLLRARGADVDATFIPPTIGRAGVRLPLRKYCVSPTWSLDAAYLSQNALRTGRALMNLRSASKGTNNYLWIDVRGGDRRSRVRQLHVQYAPADAEVAVGFKIDDGPERIVRLPKAIDGVRPGEVTLVGDAPISTLKIRVIYGTFNLQGFKLDLDAPKPVTLDVFGVPSAMARGWARIDADYVKQTLGADTYDAVILAYGTNEGNVGNFTGESYEAGLRQSLETFRRIHPASSCLLVGPTDRGVRVSRSTRRTAQKIKRPVDLLRFSRIHREITQIQARVGREYGCAAWDWQSFMGGMGSMYRWALRTPPMAASDLTHLSGGGYRNTADAIADAIGWGAPAAPQ